MDHDGVAEERPRRPASRPRRWRRRRAPSAQTRAAVSSVISHCTPWAAMSGGEEHDQGEERSRWPAGRPGSAGRPERALHRRPRNPARMGRWYRVASNPWAGRGQETEGAGCRGSRQPPAQRDPPEERRHSRGSSRQTRNPRRWTTASGQKHGYGLRGARRSRETAPDGRAPLDPAPWGSPSAPRRGRPGRAGPGARRQDVTRCDRQDQDVARRSTARPRVRPACRRYRSGDSRSGRASASGSRGTGRGRGTAELSR